MPTRTRTGIFDNEASAVDLKVYDSLKDLKWTLGDTLLYQPSYALTEEEQRDFPGSKSIKPDFVLQDLQRSSRTNSTIRRRRCRSCGLNTAGCSSRASFTPVRQMARTD